MSNPSNFLAELGKRHRLEESLRAETHEAYRAGRIDRHTKSWQPAHRSGDSAISESQSLMTSRIRDEVRNTPLFNHARSVLTDMIVGCKIAALATPHLANDDLDSIDDQYLSYGLESDDLFEEWEDFADVEGVLSWGEMQRQAFGETAEVGDSLLLECSRPDRSHAHPLCYQLLEREQIDLWKEQPRTDKQNLIRNGIEYDRHGRPVNYWIFDAHPYDDVAVGSSPFSRPVPASRVIHMFVPPRPSAHIGASWFAAIIRTGRDRDWYLGNELTAAAIGALFTAIIKREHPNAGPIGMSDGDNSADPLGNDPVKLGNGLIFEAGLKDEVEMIESKRPSRNASDFISMIDHDMAAGVGISYYRLTGRYDNTSYTAARGAHLDDAAHTKPLQAWMARRLIRPVRQQWNRQAAALGLFETVTAREFNRDLRRYQKLEILGPGREQLDPEAETEASISRLRSGLSTLKDECGLRGKHWIRNLTQIQREKAIAGRLGIVLDYSKGQGGRAEKTTTEAGNSSEGEE